MGELWQVPSVVANCQSSAIGNLHWYLVHCRSREVWRALEHLERQGFECYLPTLRVEKLRGGRKVVVQEPLFPRYLFIRLDCTNDSWYSVRSTRGVQNIVRCNGDPMPVRDNIVDGIRARLVGSMYVEPYLKPGERVQITDGPFSHLEAIFVARDGDNRVVLLLNMLQQGQKLSFLLEAVRKVG